MGTGLVTIAGFLIFGSAIGFDPCVNYTVINEPLRDTDNIPAKYFLCDRLIQPGWTRFKDAEMPFNTCIKPYHCGTHIPIWLQGRVPKVRDGITSVAACGDMTPGNADCCDYTFPVDVKNCGGFMVYNLKPVVGCSVAYCAGRARICATDKYSQTGFEPCEDAYPKLTGNPVLGIPEVIQDDFKFTCYIPYDTTEHDAVFSMTWLVDGTPIAQPITMYASGVREIAITGEQLRGHLGKSLSCSVTSAFANNHTGVTSLPWYSNTYWMGIKYQSDSVHLEPTVESKTLDIVSTIPVVCKVSGQCSVDLHLHTDNDGVQLSDCIVKLKPTDWNVGTNTAKTTIKIRPKPGQTTSSITLTTTTSTHNTGGFWNLFSVDPIHVSISPGQGASCSMHGDPHIKTFDNTRTYYMPYTGQFMAMRTKAVKKELRVDIRTWKCKKAVCICGVIAREGNDVVGLDLCHGHYRRSWPKFLIDRSLFTNETIVQHDDTGRNYVFKFPSAAYIKAHTTKENTHMDVFIHVPESMKRRTEGLCGFFDGNKDNDLTEPSGIVKPIEHTPRGFSESWRLRKGQSLFERVDPLPSTQITNDNFCDCSKVNCKTTVPPDPPIKVLCPNCRTPSEILLPLTTATKQPQTSTLGSGGRTISAIPVLPTASMTSLPYTYEFTYATIPPIFPPTQPLMSESNATIYCNRVIHAYKPASECIQGNFGLNVTDIKASCVEDLMYTGYDGFAVSALSTLVEECAMGSLMNTTNFSNLNGSNTIIKVCPGACSGNGQCYDGECLCNPGCSGSDCSVDLSLPPTMKEIVGGNLCDSNNEECYYPTVVGENLMTDGTSCVLRDMKFFGNYVVMKLSSKEIQSIFGSTSHVSCPLPKPPLPLAVHGFTIRLKTGSRESGEEFFTIYNSKCMNCSDYQHCVQKNNTCLIGNQCYQSGDVNGFGKVCNPAVNNRSWSDIPSQAVPFATNTLPLTSTLPSQKAETSSSRTAITVHTFPHTTTTVSAPISTLLQTAATHLPTAPLGGSTTPRADIWTRQDTGCICKFNSLSMTCACCEVGGEQCPNGDMCVKTGETNSCGKRKPSGTYGEDYWTATFIGCGCVFDFTRADCACCQNQGCPCNGANRNQCVDCFHPDRCGKKPWIFGPDFTTP